MRRMLCLLLLLGMFPVYAQHKLNLADENIFGVGQFVIRHRPAVYSVHSESLRTALMVGRTFKTILKNQTLTAYGYWKHDTSERQHWGFRVDIHQTFLKRKIFTRLQTRAFWGMNEDSKRQYFIIPAINYNLGRLRLGAWGMFIYREQVGDKESRPDMSLDFAYVGPSALIPFSKNAGVFVAYVVDLKQKKRVRDQAWSQAYLLHTVFYTQFKL